MSLPRPAEPPSAAAPPSFTPPRWVSWLIALVPIFPPLYLAAFGSLKLLRTLPLTARWVVFIFASTQLVATPFTPRPLLSLGLAAIRTLVILAMISAGVYLRDSRNLRPLLWGQLVICATAWGYTLATQGVAGVQARLGHPYYYIVSLGLVAVIALWFNVFWKGGHLWWRVPAAILAFTTFLAAGSRGPLLALLVGSCAALLLSDNRKRFWWVLPVILTIAALFIASFLPKAPAALQHLTSDTTSGRIFIWQDAFVGWQSSPIGGVGPYQGGQYLTSLYRDGCNLTPTLQQNQIKCPDWLQPFYGSWLIAHNVWLHFLLEAGFIGCIGLTLLMSLILWSAIASRDQLLITILFGFTAMNVVDVVIAVPSVHIAELWWTVAGLSLNKLSDKGLDLANQTNA